MEKKLFDSNCITLDGKMDEAVWNEVPTYTDFRRFLNDGGQLQPEKTYFKILPCVDRIYVGVKCMEPDMEMALRHRFTHSGYGKQSFQIFFCPTGKSFDYYHFFVGWDGDQKSRFCSEKGKIQPDPYAPVWRAETYSGEDYWSAEVEIPLTAFYMTPNDQWSDQWLVNVARTRWTDRSVEYSSWAPLRYTFLECDQLQPMGGFPIRPVEDDVRTSYVTVEIEEQTTEGYNGKMLVRTHNAVADNFEFKTNYTEPLQLSLKAGLNEFTLPCSFENLGKTAIDISLVRNRDKKVFDRRYPVRVLYEPLSVKLTLPEYRNNFYPGQDFSRIVGKVITNKQATVMLEGPGIETQTVTPDAEGNFQFDTPNFKVGDAFLTATIDGYTVQKKIRRLAPTGNTMTWVSGGNIICDGEPVLPRKMYGPGWRGGVVFNARYDSETQYITKKFKRQSGDIMAATLVKGSEASGGEATKDAMPSEEMLSKIDAIIEKNKGTDFAFYYLNDEPDLRSVSPIYLRYVYEHIAEKDPYHVVMLCLKNSAPYIECADWLQTHPYIIPYNNPDGTRTYTSAMCDVGSNIDCVVKLNRPDKCMGFLPTCYAYKSNSKNYDYPTFDEVVTHTWAAMIHGGKSLWPYAYHGMNDRASMYQGIRYLFSSFETLEDIVLFGKRTTLFRSDVAEAVLYTHGEEKMFVAVNFTPQDQTVTIDGIDGTAWYHFRRAGMLEGNTFCLKPFETMIGTSNPKGEDLPLYDDVRALVEKQEYARTHTGNLLFDRKEEMSFTASNSCFPDFTKLFDGVYDNLGLELRRKEEEAESFFEIDITKIAPSFKKVVVHGYQVDGMTIQIRTGETLITPEVENVITQQYSTTILLKETVKPDNLRLIFKQDFVQLYEIEVF